MKEALAHEIRQASPGATTFAVRGHALLKVAIKTAEAVEKIRINPGNFADGREDEANKVYESDNDFLRDREYITEAFAPLVETCRDLNRCMRIGTNHGSLSARILAFYGDSPRGMVESAIELADICCALELLQLCLLHEGVQPGRDDPGYRLLAAEMYRSAGTTCSTSA